MTHVRVTVNDRAHDMEVSPRKTLAEVLRDDLGLTGTHLACEHGVCGACSVVLDGEVVRSCLVLGAQADGCVVTTVEGEASDDGLGPVQRGFLDAMSFQCGFCTSGFVVATSHWIRRRRAAGEGPPTELEVREALAANLCRCTGYQAIVDGVLRAWANVEQEGEPCND